MKFLIAILILSIFLIAGCTQTSQTQPSQKKLNQSNQTNQINQSNQTNNSSSVIVCNPPQIRFGSGCCLDANNNSICDKDVCMDVVCDDYCSNNTLYYNGRCINNVCQYLSMVCSDGCTNGRCITFNPLYPNTSFGINANSSVGSKTIFVEFTNTGFQNIDMTQVIAYLGSKYANISSGSTGILAPGNSKILNITTNISTCGSMILISLASGQSQSGTVYCFATGFGHIQIIYPWSIAAADGTMHLNVLNRTGDDITIMDAKVKIGSSTYNYSVLQTFASGESIFISFITNKWTTKIKSGSSYTATVTVDYNYSGSVFNSTGTLSGKYL